MKVQHVVWYPIAVAAVAGVLFATGSRPSAALLVAVLLACPLMMFFMMGGMHGGQAGRDQGHRHGPQLDERAGRDVSDGARPGLDRSLR